MIWSNLAKLFIGVILAIALLVGGGVALAMYFLHAVSTPPPKPIFVNDTTKVKAQRPPSSKTVAQKTASATPTLSQSTSPTPKPLEPGAYRAQVSWPQGLIMRAEPNLDAEQIGSAGHNQKIIVLRESADKNWEQVRLENSEQEGWIKAGNTQRVKEAQ